MLKRFPLRIQLTALTSFVTLLALVVAFAGFLWRDMATFRADMLEDTRTRVEMIGANSLAALAFGDSNTAEETLSTLRLTPDVEAAALYTKDGKLLAAYTRNSKPRASLPSVPKGTSYQFKEDHLESRYLIRDKGEIVGSLYIESNLNAWNSRKNSYAAFHGLLSLGSIMLAALIGWRLQRGISHPILRLVQAMKSVREEKNFSVRMKTASQDEIGQMAIGFNQMLEEIEARDEELLQAKNDLEERVERRTAQLAQEVADRQAKERQIAEFFETAPLGIMRIDRDGNILAVNRTQLNMLGSGAEEVVGKHVSDLKFDVHRVRELLGMLLAGERVRDFEIKIHTNSGAVLDLQVNGSALVEDGEFVHAGLFIRDITLEKKAEEAEIAKMRAERANQAKSEFLSRMSHELRTPMNSILGFGQLLEMEPLEPRAKESVEQILKGGRHLLNLINEVLNISRIEAGTMSISLEPVSLEGIMREAVDLITPMATQHGITIEDRSREAGSVCVRADRQRLSQVLINLLSNAVKYNSEDGTITCTSEITPSGKVRIGIADTGKGVSDADAERLFVPFDRLGAEKSQIEGTGLGLALTKTLVEAMRGSIWLDRTYEGPGSRFYLEFEQAQENEGAAALEIVEGMAQERLGAEAKTVLLIEDNLANVKLIEQLFASHPHIKLLVAMQGLIGIEFAREHHPDLVLLDINLPDTTGFEVAERLKQDAQLSRTPLVVISADATPTVRHQLQQLGVHCYFTKPLDVRLFMETVKQLLADEVKLSA